MAQEQLSRPAAERRCPNCGTRVARDAESCFMCGYDLRREPKRKRQVSWVDALLVIAVLGVVLFWWQAGSRQSPDDAESTEAAGIPAAAIPILPAEPTITPTNVPATPAEEAPSKPSGTVEHEVVQGETLLSIALDYGITVDEVRAANGLTGDLIRPGDRLTIPNQQAVVAPQVGQAAPKGPVSTFDYVVQDGDTIISIAARLGSTVEEILSANGLGVSDLIRPGDSLKIPVRQVPSEVLESSSTVQETSAALVEGATPVTSTRQTGIYAAPQLIAPADNATLPSSEAVLLRWASVDLLKQNEWYVVLLYPQSQDARQFPSIWTKSTSHRMELEYAPEPGKSASYSWQVSVVRVNSKAGGGYGLEPASPTSELRRFTWE
jgi:LysM repeat protein/predicted nucleic acid-binding Zn ribbon protein